MPENTLSEDFAQWVREQLQEHRQAVQGELEQLEQKKSLSITVKLKLKAVGSLFVPSYSFSIPRAAVKSEAKPDKQLALPGV
jgi:Holliday junction resolvase RusA-like endonuclease